MLNGRLGVIHRDGLGVPHNSRTALEFFSLAAAQGRIEACSYMGTSLPVHFFFLPPAQLSEGYHCSGIFSWSGIIFDNNPILGQAYKWGKGVDQDYSKAVMYLTYSLIARPDEIKLGNNFTLSIHESF